jgi:hypothetical protein
MSSLVIKVLTRTPEPLSACAEEVSGTHEAGRGKPIFGSEIAAMVALPALTSVLDLSVCHGACLG